MKSIYLLAILLLSSCGSVKSYKSENYNSTDYLRVSIQELVGDPDFYNNKYIEVDAMFFYGMEEASLVSEKNSSIVLWIDFDYSSQLNDDEGNSLFSDDRLIDYSNKRIKIKGVFDKENTGHLGIYKGAIKNIGYFGSGLSD